MENSESIFDLLGNDPGAIASLRIRESDVAVSGGNAAHAIDPAGRRLLLVPLSDDQTTLEDLTSRGVTLQERALVDGDQTRRFSALRCELPALQEPFGVLCDEVLADLAANAGDPSGTCKNVLERWRDLLGPRSDHLLGESALLGLLAEVRFLERVVARDVSALSLWTGPGGERVDFTGSTGVVEVKGTSSRDRFTVEIHGLLQLDPPDGKKLFLWAEQFERVPAGGDSVPEAVQRVCALGVDSHQFFTLLQNVGYVAADSESYASIRFSPLAERAFEIGEGFPRLVRSSLNEPSLADRITALRYGIDLSDADALSGGLPGPEAVVAGLLGESS